jgi:intracellular sulfur oxidation DsrE/DsrF family protein
MTSTNHINDIVILHASDDPADVQRALGLAKDILVDPECTDRVTVVVNHAAITGIATLSHATIPDGITIVACAKAMRTHDIDSSQLDSCIHVVPSGIVYLAEQQNTHSWYIRL